MTDVTQLILDDHETFRSRFAELDDLRNDPSRAGPVWEALARLLEVHASAEEEHVSTADPPVRHLRLGGWCQTTLGEENTDHIQ